MDLITYALLKKAIDEIKSLSPFTYKGSVASESALPTNANKGDVYTTSDDGCEYLWDGTKWVNLGADLTSIKADIAELKKNSLMIEGGE